MDPWVQGLLIVCATGLIALWMLRSTIKTLAESDKDDFTFIFKIPWKSLKRGSSTREKWTLLRASQI